MNKAKEPKIIALIPACGRGTRLKNGEGIPKQYLKINDISILRYTILNFLDNPQIDDILCIINPQDIDLYNEAIKGIDILDPVYGGNTRQKSILNGLTHLNKEHRPDIVLIHDAVRPFTSKKIINGIIEKLKTHPAVIPAVAIEDTIKKISEDQIEWTLERQDLWRAQTPQGFIFEDILNSHKAFQSLSFTDDSSINEYAGIPVAIVPGSQNNFKITTAEDYERAKNLAESLSKQTTAQIKKYESCWGTGFDFHKLQKSNKIDNKIRLGGVDIEFHQEIIAHSDGDVLIHAIIDALLGAIGEGDIGDHFPDNDKKWHDANSLEMLKIIADLINKKSIHINNIDATIICQEPKISPYKEAMKDALSKTLNIEKHRINIKATTTENLGFLGRNEAIACQAIASVDKLLHDK